MNATQPSVAFTTITAKASLLVPSPFRSAPGTLPSGRSARTPAYQVVAVVSRPIRPAPPSARPATATVPSPVGVTGVSRTTPSPEKSRTSSSLGAPVLVTIRPSTPGATPGCAAVSWLTRQHEGSEVWAGEFARRLEEKGQRLARFFWQDDRVHEPAGGGESGVELMLRSEERRVGKECRSRWSPY